MGEKMSELKKEATKLCRVGKKETIERQHIELCVEEFETLLHGGTINLLENDDGEVILTIQGINTYKELESDLCSHSLNKRIALRENILERYDNSEYCERDIINNPDFD